MPIADIGIVTRTTKPTSAVIDKAAVVLEQNGIDINCLTIIRQNNCE